MASVPPVGHGVPAPFGFGGLDWAALDEDLQRQPYRSDGGAREITLRPGDFVQMVNLKTETAGTIDGHIDHYSPIAPATAVDYINGLASLGIRGIYTQFVPDNERLPAAKKLAEYAEAVAELRRGCPPQTEIIVDPIALCIGDNLRWGVLRDGSSNIDVKQTARLVWDAAGAFAQAGASAYLTLGRVNHEALIASNAIAASQALAPSGKPAQVYSFSTNSETAFAYFTRVAGDPRRAHTGQKIPVGNHHEMTAQALLDAYEGTDVMLQKPVENLALLERLRDMQLDRASFDAIVRRPRIRGLLDAYRDPRRGAGPVDLDTLHDRFARMRLGAYEVSGTTVTNGMIRNGFGEPLAFTLQHELYTMAQAAAGDSLHHIVGRTMDRFVRYLRGAL